MQQSLFKTKEQPEPPTSGVPVQQLVSKPFATKGEVANYFSGARIQCLLCGKWLKSLATHLVRVHETSVDEYKIMFGLPHSRGLVSEMTAKRQAASLQKRIDEGDKSIIVDPTTLDKTPHKQKHKPVHYSKKARSPRMVKLNQKRREDFLEQLNKFDWANILGVMVKENIGAWSLAKLPDMPTYWQLMEKIHTDTKFAEKYAEIKKTLKKVKKECPICKKIFEVKLSHSKKRRTCSYDCMAKDYKNRGISFGGNRWKKVRPGN